MKNIAARLIPDFMRRLDYYFLLHNRLIWITKIHYVVWYAILILGMSALIINMIPIDKAHFYHAGMWVWLLSILMLIPFGFWIFQQISFSIENNYGKHSKSIVYAQWALQFLAIAIFVAVPVLGGIMGQERIANIVEDTDFVEDINILNQGNPYFPTSQYRDNIKKHHLQNQDDYYYAYNFNRFTPHDSHLILENIHQESELDKIYHEAISSQPAQYQRIEKFISIFNQYGGQITQTPESILHHFEKMDTQPIHLATVWEVRKSPVFDAINVIASAKAQKTIPIRHTSFWVFLTILAFMGSVILMVFQQSQVRDFVIALLSGILLLIGLLFMTFITTEILNIHLGNNYNSNFLVFSLLLYSFLMYHALSISQLPNYSRFKTVALIIVALTSPFLVWGLGLLAESFGQYGGLFSAREYDVWAGFVMYGVILLPIFKNLLIRVQALPK